LFALKIGVKSINHGILTTIDYLPMTMFVKLEVKSKKLRIRRNIKAPRSCTASVGSAFRYNPIG
jgi:hypothetical protein